MIRNVFHKTLQNATKKTLFSSTAHIAKSVPLSNKTTEEVPLAEKTVESSPREPYFTIHVEQPAHLTNSEVKDNDTQENDVSFAQKLRKTLEEAEEPHHKKFSAF